MPVTTSTSTRRKAALAGFSLLLLAACQEQRPLVVVAAQPGSLGAQLASTLPPAVPMQTALALNYGAAQPGFASLYTIGTSGTIVRLFENRPVQPGTLSAFPAVGEPVMRFGPPAGAEQFVLVVTAMPVRWLGPQDQVDQTAYPRLAMDRLTFESRLSNALAQLPPGSWQVQRLNISTF